MNRHVGHYQILSLLGKGGMGEVYRARDTRLDREVAIKSLPVAYSRDSDRLRRFEQEARAAGKLNHPNVLTVYDTGMHDEAPYIVTELLEGEDLRARLKQGPVPQRRHWIRRGRSRMAWQPPMPKASCTGISNPRIFS